MSKNGFVGCKFCGGKGCLACEGERKRATSSQPEMPEPLFTARLDNPHDMKLLKSFAGREALEHAFGPDGGGMQEVERGAAIASFIQFLHKNDNAQNDSGDS